MYQFKRRIGIVVANGFLCIFSLGILETYKGRLSMLF